MTKQEEEGQSLLEPTEFLQQSTLPQTMGDSIIRTIGTTQENSFDFLQKKGAASNQNVSSEMVTKATISKHPPGQLGLENSDVIEHEHNASLNFASPATNQQSFKFGRPPEEKSVTNSGIYGDQLYQSVQQNQYNSMQPGSDNF